MGEVMNYCWENEKKFDGKRWHIQHTHFIGKSGQLSSGGKTKEFLEWEKSQKEMISKDIEEELFG
jgi:hypothetical protein